MSAIDLKEFHWEPCPEGQALLDEWVADFMQRNSFANELSKRMTNETGTRFFDWIDHIEIPDSQKVGERLSEAGFEKGKSNSWQHLGAIFPRVILGNSRCLAIKVESVSDFLTANHCEAEIIGSPFDQFRMAEIIDGFGVVERRGYRRFDKVKTSPKLILKSREIYESLCRRKRDFDGDDELAFQALNDQLDIAIAKIGRDWTCHLFFAAERDYWMRRNRAGRIQKSRQDRLGLGWANHDHHTYRCKRKTFHQVIGVFERLGFTCRERFYAGAQAGWGAQIVEHATTGVTIFADVDMSAEEVTGDFAHEGFVTDRKEELGTVGLWCELHGESILEAGMHHLEAQFDFDGLREQILVDSGIGMMKPFTNFDYLRQQFTEGERWVVKEQNIDRLLASGDITEKQAESFRNEGAVGSHLENLERNDGFKGFNQVGISDIIERTDARKIAEN